MALRPALRPGDRSPVPPRHDIAALAARQNAPAMRLRPAARGGRGRARLARKRRGRQARGNRRQKMTRRSLDLSDELYDYLLEISLREPPVMARLRAETAAMPRAGMQIAPEQGQFMGFLVELIGARLCLELGTFTGYSALAIAEALPPDGQLICCDIDAEATALAERYWAEAGLADRIQLRLGRALDTLAEIEREYPPGSFDLVFIDADKQPYDRYYEAALRL